MKETQMAGRKITLLDLAKDVVELGGQALSKLDEMIGREILKAETEATEPNNRVDNLENWLFLAKQKIEEINSCLDRLSLRFG